MISSQTRRTLLGYIIINYWIEENCRSDIANIKLYLCYVYSWTSSQGQNLAQDFSAGNKTIAIKFVFYLKRALNQTSNATLGLQSDDLHVCSWHVDCISVSLLHDLRLFLLVKNRREWGTDDQPPVVVRHEMKKKELFKLFKLLTI